MSACTETRTAAAAAGTGRQRSPEPRPHLIFNHSHVPATLLLQDVVQQRGLAGTQEAGDLRQAGAGGREAGGTLKRAAVAREALEGRRRVHTLATHL